MIKAILFDYDGVITQGVDVTLPAHRLANNVGISVDEATKCIRSIWDGYSTGKTTEEEVWTSIESQICKEIAASQRNIWHTWEELIPITFMLEFVAELKAKDYQVGLLSNVFKETADIIRRNRGYDAFDFMVLSCEVGARKPESLAYESAMHHLDGIQPDEVLFLDDRQHCIDGAKAFGWHTIQVVDHVDAMNEVRSMLKIQ